ncbi:MAG: SGNH/GDSL hydrolase family protein [Candidatus Bathyarchaeia archaeon]
MSDFTLKSDEKIVLIGDSITDCGRLKEFLPLGNGYVCIAANLTTAKYPDRNIKWVNKGVSGDTVQGLVNRWSEDVVEEKPDWVSIYIGINNVAQDKSSNKNLKDLLGAFESSYRKILEKTKNETKAKIIIFEIFYVASEDMNKREFDVSPYNKIIHKLAGEYKAILVPINVAFKEAVRRRPDCQWTTGDGVHPSPLGHALIALKFLESLGW